MPTGTLAVTMTFSVVRGANVKDPGENVICFAKTRFPRASTKSVLWKENSTIGVSPSFSTDMATSFEAPALIGMKSVAIPAVSGFVF